MKKAKANGKSAVNHEPPMKLRLYVAGQTPKSLAALSNLKKICAKHLDGKYELEVIDLMKNPHLAQGDQILAIPTLVRNLPVADAQNYWRSVQRRPRARRSGSPR